MERLTEKELYDGKVCFTKCAKTHCLDKCVYCDIPEEVHAKLKDYENLEEQGKLLKLPCAVGDTVYVKMQFAEYAEAEVRDYSFFLSCGFCVVVTSDKFNKQHIPFTEFGKTIFLTQAEAEAALNELQR